MKDANKMILWLVPVAVLFVSNVHAGKLTIPEKIAMNVAIPPKVKATYEKLVKVLRSGDEAVIKKMTLHDSVMVTSQPRAPGKEEWGREINLPFIRSGFQDEIQLTRSYDGGDVFFIRTNTSYFMFVETKKSGWKLYRYGDKPIE